MVPPHWPARRKARGHPCAALVYATGLSIAISLREPVLVRIMPDRMTLYTLASDGTVHNRFRVVASNRSHAAKELTLSLEGLPQGTIVDAGQPVSLAPGESLQREFDVAAPRERLNPASTTCAFWPMFRHRKPRPLTKTFLLQRILLRRPHKRIRPSRPAKVKSFHPQARMSLYCNSDFENTQEVR